MSEENKQSASSPQSSTPAGEQPDGGNSNYVSAETARIPQQYVRPSGENGGSLSSQAGGASGKEAEGAKGRAEADTTAPVNTANPKPHADSSAVKRPVGLRRIRMTISKVDILSAIKLGFLLSVVFAFMVVIAMAIIWFVLDGIHVFYQIQGLLETLNSAALLEFMEYLEFGRWMSFAVIIAILDVVLLTALSAIGALVYNLISSLVGGVRISVTDE